MFAIFVKRAFGQNDIRPRHWTRANLRHFRRSWDVLGILWVHHFRDRNISGKPGHSFTTSSFVVAAANHVFLNALGHIDSYMTGFRYF